VPLAIVLEALEDAARRARDRMGSGSPRSLAFVSRAVEQAWEVILSGRASGPSPSTLPGLTEILAAWTDARDRAPDGDPLRLLLDECIQGLERDVAPARVDATMDRRLADCVPRELSVAAEQRAASDLEPYRGRMTASTFESTRARAVADRLRQALELPRASLADAAR
jgi:hypothetical protein